MCFHLLKLILIDFYLSVSPTLKKKQKKKKTRECHDFKINSVECQYLKKADLSYSTFWTININQEIHDDNEVLSSKEFRTDT